jgi:DNA-binding response OmpR family regulator
MRICIIDDHDLIRDALALVLADAGHEVLFAMTGAAGVSIAEGASLDAVVIDYDLPDMKGDAVAAAIRAGQPALPIILASGWYSPTANLDGVVDLFLQKPFTPKALIASVEKAKANRGAAA